MVGRRFGVWSAAVGLLFAGLAGAAGTACGGTGSSAADDGGVDVPADVPDDADGDDPDGSSPEDGAGDVPVAACGNRILETGEECDLDELGDATCASLGLTPGTLACGDDCRFDVVGCAVCDDGHCEGGETPTSCPGDCAVRHLAAGTMHACAVLADGRVRCWGGTEGHRIPGLGDARRPVEVPSITGALEVATGMAHTCAVLSDGTARCWGRNGFGELGRRTISTEEGTPAPVAGLTGVTHVGAGSYHTCAWSETGGTFCWGRGDHGAVGDGTWTARQPTPIEVDLASTSRLTVFAGGDHHSCGQVGSTVKCWGDNNQGEVGVGTPAWRSSPALTVPGYANALGSGAVHACAQVLNPFGPLMSGLFCWGSNSFGQLGVPAGPDVLGPQRLSDVAATAIAGGYGHTCVLGLTPSVVQCWGDNHYGQLGDGTEVSRHTPAEATGLTTVTALALGRDFSCALLADDTVRCWGRNHRGQLGDGSSDRRRSTPVEPVGL
ncbi:MAG: hypothetical protein JXB32_20715 [Deltaproteobacteria bacterium]|nr:hypothetical protein [Deltaproteobacteria bacterium]